MSGAAAASTATLTDFLNALHPPDGTGLIELRALPSGAQGFFRLSDTHGIEHFISTHAHENVYFAVAARKSPGDGSLANCAELTALFVDLDFNLNPA